MRMLRPVWVLLVGMVLLVAGNRASAQGIDLNDPEIQEMIQMGMQTMQRMQEAGIDFRELAAQVQSGEFDSQGFQQMLIDRGIIDGAFMNRIQNTGQRVMSRVLKQLLASTDDEWAIIGPKIDKVIAANSVTQQQGSMQWSMGNVRNVSSVFKAMEALKAELKEPGTTDAKIAIKLKEWREAHAKAKEDLKVARDDLRSVLTLRQEVILMNFGLLD